MQNRFIVALEGLLDQLHTILPRENWDAILLLNSEEVGSWLNGNSIPRADQLQKIISNLSKYNTEEIVGALTIFHNMADKPLIEIMNKQSALLFNNTTTVSDYYLTAYKGAFEFEMHIIPSTLKKETLFFCAKVARSICTLAMEKDRDFSKKDLASILGNISEEDIVSFLQEQINKTNPM